MAENINNLHRLADLKTTLLEKRVSENSVKAIEKALRGGLVFRKAADLGILNLPPADIEILGTAVGFGAPAPEANVHTLEFTFVPKGNVDDFYGYQFILTYTNRDRFSISESYPIEDSRVVYVDFDKNDLAPSPGVTYRVKTPDGAYALVAAGASGQPADDFILVENAAVRSATIAVATAPLEAAEDLETHVSYRVKGKLISSVDDKTDGYQIVVMAATKNLPDTTPDFFPVGFATTETNGYFLTGLLIFNDPADSVRLLAAKAIVNKDGKVWERSIALEEGDNEERSIPRRLIIVIDGVREGADGGDEEGCGCNDLNFHEKKTLEEYSYYTVVRTTEPAIIANTLEEEDEVDLDDIYGTSTGIKVPLSVFKKYHLALNTQVKAQIAPQNLAGMALTSDEGTAVMARKANPALGSLFNKDLLDKIVIDTKVSNELKGKKKRHFKGRSYLTPLNQIDWDDEPTIYQAASVAHGHLLHFKQEWRPDGYSIGDLMYSLPLAPGQKKQIAVLDWERRESAANSQSLDYEETLNNTLVRDRDISEVVNATLNENIKATSKAATGGWGFGMGGAIMGVFNGGTFGALHGISGGKSTSGSTASQNSHRDSTASSLQSLSDRTTQAASSVRSQRATVIQTVSQGERVQATAESVANYNHCHAITIQYFEVLRHFSVHTRLAGVQECLFVPLQITTFDLEKCLRWRNTLERYLFRPQLRLAFDSIMRILKEKENAEDYYGSIGFPRTNFAEQPMKAFSGALFFEFAFFNTQEGKVSDDLVRLLRVFGFSIDPAEYNDRTISNRELADMVGPRAIEFLLNSIVVEIDKGNDLRLDLTLLNRFRQNAVLQVSLRQSASSPTYIRRDQVNGLKIRIDKSRLSVENKDALEQFGNKFMKITIRSGNLRYRSDSMSQLLFSGSINNDLFADGDSVYIDTPLNGDELRNPRGEDVDAANKLLHHLNENLEYYHKAIWSDMTAERRFMLLDGIIAPGKAKGRSVASVVENKLIGIAGNSLVMPVAPGNQLDPTISEDFNLFEQYFNEENDPVRISLPTKGVYAESVMGKCNACEEKDNSRFWRWEESPIPDSPNTQILPLNTNTRRADPGSLQPKDFPNPVVNIQNAPNVPDPAGVRQILDLLGKGDAFRDLSGLNQNQLNALATYQKTLETAQSFGKEAAELAKAAAIIGMANEAHKSGGLSKQDYEKTVKDQLPPSAEKERKAADEDVNQIQQDQESGLIDESQARQLTEDRRRKSHGTVKPTLLNDDPAIQEALRRAESFDVSRSDAAGKQSVSVTRVNLAEDAENLIFPVEMELTQCDNDIIALVEASPLVNYNWPGRGAAPIGYLKGMALTYARVYCKWLGLDPFVQQMAQAMTANGQIDALRHYQAEFAAMGMNNNQSGADTLRHLFVLLVGLGMRESSGEYCEGRDMSANNVSPETAEAGVFQMSLSIGVASNDPARRPLRDLYDELRTIPYTGYRSVFAEDVNCTAGQVTGFGNTVGGKFRRFCVMYPALSAEIAALGLRIRRQHWGPINGRTVTLNPDCDTLLSSIQQAIDSGNCCSHFAPNVIVNA